MAQLIKTSHWLKFGLALIVPLLLYAVLAERASWRPHVLRYPELVEALSYSPDGRWVACAMPSHIELRDAATQRVVWRAHPAYTEDVPLVFAPDSQTLAIQSQESIQLWNVATGTLRCSLHPDDFVWDGAQDIFFVPDTVRLITTRFDNPTLLWDTRQGKELSMISSVKFMALALSPDGQTLALRSGLWPDYTIFVSKWLLRQPPQQLPLPPHDGALGAFFMPDNNTLAVVTSHGKIMFWDLARQQWTHQFTVFLHLDTIMAFSPDGHFYANSVGHEVKLWETRHGTLTRVLKIPDAMPTSLDFTPDSATLYTISGRTIHLWRLK